MNRQETPTESLRGYLRQLSPQTRTRLLAEIERLRQSGEDFPGADLIIAELRAEIRQDGRAAERLEPAARHFFRLLEPYLTDRPADRANAGQISRASLPAIWEWLSRDLMASMARAYTAEIKQFLTAGQQRELEQAAQSFQNKTVKYLEGTLASSNGAAQARARLAVHGGAPATFDDLGKVLRVLKARDALAQFGNGLPARIDKLIGAQLDKLRAALDAFAARNRDAVPFALTLTGRHLTASWQLVRFATKATETKAAAAIAATPYAIAITLVLDKLEDWVEALRDALREERIPRAKELLANIYDTEYALRVRIELANSDWGRRLDAIMAATAEALESETHTMPSGLRHVLRSPGLKHYQSVRGRLTRLYWQCRDAVTGRLTQARHFLANMRGSHA
jgi:hypothetical protein